MAYHLNSITVRTNNTNERIKKIDDIWADVLSGRLPILFDSNHQMLEGVSPVSKYHNFKSDENDDYDLSIISVTAEFFQKLEEAVIAGTYKKYDAAGEDLALCTKDAWLKVWDDKKTGAITRNYKEDFESTVPAEYTKDGKAHCYLYIGVL